MKVETYTLTASNGRKIRTATRVIFDNGHTVHFMERLTKAEAIKSVYPALVIERDGASAEYETAERAGATFAKLGPLAEAVNVLHDAISEYEAAGRYVGSDKGDYNDRTSRWHY